MAVALPRLRAVARRVADRASDFSAEKLDELDAKRERAREAQERAAAEAKKGTRWLGFRV